MRGYLIDTIGAVVFFTTVAGFSELVIAGMHPGQVLVARLITIPVMMLTGRPYGIWRDFVFVTLTPQRRFARFACDIAAFLTFQVPVYMATLALAGATFPEIIAAVGAAIIFMIVLSRPYGLFLDALRKWAGTTGR